ncbi:pectate lyase-like adhesive domain-containing protein [Gemmiger sp.]
MKKRIVSTLLALCMLLCLMPTAAFAEDSTETPPVCSCETACTAESMNTDCPVCGAEGALPESCAKCAQPADAAAVQPVGEVSDPQPEPALTALSGEGVTPAAGETIRDVRTADELTAAIADSSVNTVRLAGDISISSFLTVTRTVTLDLNGHVLQMTGNDSDPVIEVKKDSNGVGIGNLTLTDSAPNTAHKFTPNADGLWVLDEENGTKTVNGGVITGSKEMGIWVDGGYGPPLTQKPAEADCAHLIMEGGNIVGCAAMAGGGVYASFYAYFTMSGGSIRGCVAKAGGGVCLSYNASFAMGGSALIADCISTDGGSCGGGGIGADLHALVALSGNAVIQNCTAQLGGGVYLNDATLTMSGNASVTGCNSIAGGGVYVRGNVTENDPPVFTMEGSSSITDCTAVNGGGIFVATHSGKVSLSDSAKIKNCHAVEKVKLDFPNVTGGGVHVSSGSFEMSGGSIEGCTAVNGGDSVFVSTGDNGKFTMTGGTVDGSITMPYTVGNNPVYMDGLGTAVSPYQISTADQLKLFRDIVNGSNDQTPNAAACAVLTADIDLNKEPWMPIGPDRDSAYTGTFDGQGHTVKNLSVTVNVQPCRAGLFGCVKDGTIRKLTVAGSVSCTANQGWCGGIAGYAMDETIENCASLCTVSCTGIDARVGGIVGLVDYNSSALIIRDCYNIGKITGRSDNGSGDAGGICGFYMGGKISNCYNVGEITGSGYVSKIAVSAFNDSRPTNCYYLSDTDTDLNGTAKTAAEFANGDVLEELKAGRNDSPWDSCQYVATAKMTLPVFKGQGDKHTHQSSNWESNETEHWQVCTCGVVFNKAQHSFVPATCTQKAKCTVCNTEYGAIDPANHTGTEQWTQTTTTHEKKWSCCGVVTVQSENHKWTDGVCSECGYVCQHKDTDKNHICDICGKTISEHKDADNNHICDYCNKKISDHTGGTATCKDKAICEICKESYGSLDPNNHTDLKHIDAKAATAAEEGNIAYWYCDGCKRYFSDAAAKTEITEAATVTPKLPPKITAGDGAAVTQGEKNELTFTSNASFADFLRVELDGATLEEKNYTKREGSTIITLNRDFAAALSVGEHTLAIVSQHGTATAKFTVNAKPAETATPQPTETTTPQPTAQPRQTAQPQPTVQPTVQPVSPIPRTGDTANPALWFALLIVSGSALAAIFVLRRKANRK